MREWHKPTIDETESPAWKSQATCRQSWIALNPISHVGNTANGDPAKSPIAVSFFGVLAASPGSGADRWVRLASASALPNIPFRLS
jgi:hypothetical protein